MENNTEQDIIFPENIKRILFKKFKEKISSISDDVTRSFYERLLDPEKEIEYDVKTMRKFLEKLYNKSLKNDFISLFRNFRDEELYNHFLASIRIYSRIDDLPCNEDMFLYLIIAIEASLNYGGKNKGEGKKKLFKSFFKENLSKNTKIKLVSSFYNKRFDTYKKGVHREVDDILREKTGREVYHPEINEPISLPACYKKDSCYIEYGRCHPEIYCHLNQHEGQLENYLDAVLEYLYKKRCDAVHEGKFFTPQKQRENGIDFIGIVDYYKDGIISFKITLEELFSMYEEALLNFFR